LIFIGQFYSTTHKIHGYFAKFKLNWIESCFLLNLLSENQIITHIVYFLFVIYNNELKCSIHQRLHPLHGIHGFIWRVWVPGHTSG
jgi:hypothetical protein